MSKNRSLKNAVVVVTGGARGIGLATAKQLLDLGARVVIADIDSELAQKEAHDLGALAVTLDIRDHQSIQQCIDTVEKQLGPIDGWINNAGIMPMGAFVEEPSELSQTQIEINLIGLIAACKMVLPGMLSRKRGRIVNVASLAGRFGLPGAAVYSATKFGVVGFTEALREEYRDSGVHIASVLPSKVLTELSSGTNEGRLIPAVTPEQVADGIITALSGKADEVVVPQSLSAVASAYGALPTRVARRFRRLIDDHRILNSLDHNLRKGYTSRLAQLTTLKR